MKKIISYILMFILLVPIVVNAHTIPPNSVVIGNEEIGWVIDLSCHNSGTTLYYKFDNTDPYISNYKKIVVDGTALWSPTVTISENSNAVGTILTREGSTAPDAPVAVFLGYNPVPDSGHHTRWEIIINRKKSANKIIMAHELGHAFGLLDLQLGINIDKLMYGYANLAATAPTAMDKMGVRVISGSHSTHTFRYRFFDVSSGVYRDCRYCIVCNGYRDVAPCTYTNNVCTKCGVTKGGPHPYSTQD